MANLGYIQLTRECNQECRFCSNPPNENRLEYDEALKIIDGFKKERYDGVIFTGGEPTLFDRLDELVQYSKRIDLGVRIITNGQKLADKNYFDTLVEAGLEHLHLSIHSVRDKVQGFLTGNDQSLQNIFQVLEYCRKIKISVNINTVINKYNADHLDETVQYLVNEYPFINHFVWNNLDPHMNRVSQFPEVIPKLQEVEITLYNAAKFLQENKRSFRIERVPLCYMAEFAEYSTETRKIVKNEERIVYFLDEKGKVSQNNFYYEKAPVCKECTLNPICAGIYGGNQFYSFKEIYPLFLDVNAIKSKIIKT